MLKEGIYTLSELAEYLTERTAKNEFKPKKGPKVDRENAENNRKAVDDIMKDTEKHSGVKVPKRNNNGGNTVDFNCTTLEYRYTEEPDEGFKDREKEQVGNDDYYNERKKVSKEREERREADKKAGLNTSKVVEELGDKIIKSKTAFKESKNMKRLHFKNTCFLSEAQMFSRIPEEYKTDGNVFIMRDATGTDYLVECRVDDTYGCKSLKVVNKMNKQSVNEELDRMRGLYEYRSDANGAADDRDMSDMLDGIRELGKK